MKRNKVLIVVALVIGFAILALSLDLSFENIKAWQAEWSGYCRENLTISLLIFGVGYAALTAISFPGASALSLLAGAFFGNIYGTTVVISAATTGALCAFLFVRYMAGEGLRERLSERFQKVDRGIKKDGARFLFMMRLNPVIPFFLINMGMALTSMRAWTYTWVSFIGMLPGTFLYVNAGTQLSQMEKLSGVISPPVLISLIAVGLLPLIGSRIWR